MAYRSVCKLTDVGEVAQHFLLSARARSLSIAQVLRMTDEDAELAFAALRWPETGGKAVCVHCGCPTCYECRRPSGALRFRCKACRGDFSLTSGTLFAFHKLPLRTYLAAVVIFCNEVKGKSALALSRDLGVQYKTAFVLAHKLREAMATEMRGAKLGGKGAVVEVDGGYFGGYVKPANHKENRRDRRLAKNQSGKRQVVVVIRQRDGRTLPGAFPSEAAALSHIRDLRAKPGFRPTWRARPKSTPTKRPGGTTCTPGTWSSGSTTNSPTAWTAATPTGRRASFPGCAGARWGTTTTSPGRTSPVMPRKARGGRTTAGTATGGRCAGS